MGVQKKGKDYFIEYSNACIACAVLKPLVMIAVYTGMRKGGILGLEWRDIDFNQGIIHVERSFGRG